MHIRSRSRDRSRFGGGFFPGQLFFSGAQGAWYDPSDYSTLYQDANGTTPVTAVEQPVRLMLDRSRGLVLGSELVTNGDFSDGTTTGWTAVTTTLSVVSGELKVVNDSAGVGQANQAITTVVGRLYKILASMRSDATNVTADSCRLVIGTSPTVSYFVTANGVQRNVEAFFIATSTSTNLGFQIASSGAAGASGDTIYIDNISVRELPGNHAVAPNDASRPVLRARYNLLTRTEEFDDAAWTKSNTTVTDNAAVAPDGTTTAETWTLNAGVAVTIAFSGLFTSGVGAYLQTSAVTLLAAPYTASIYVKAGSGLDHVQLRAGTASNLTGTSSNVIVRLSDGAVIATDGTTVVTNAGNGWWRIQHTWTATATAWYIGLWAWNSTSIASTAGNENILIWGAQLLTAADHAATGGAYQRVGAATDYDTGPPWRPYLAFDGSDDSMSTSSIDFSGTDKMTVFAGVSKLSNAVGQVVFELSADSISNNGTFAAFSSGNEYIWRSRGTTTRTPVVAGYNAPITNVLTGIGDISGDVATLRINGAQAATNTDDQGTGNYGNYPLFIGRRNNTSAPFNGRLYGLTVLGRTATAPELSAMESWIAGKTGVSL